MLMLMLTPMLLCTLCCRCPLKFLEQLACLLRPKAFPPAEDLVAPGAYGEDFIILLIGSLTVVNDGEKVIRQVQDSDREPIVGLAACLADPQLKRVKQRTDTWTVKSDAHCDTVWVRRKAFQACLLDHWPEGREEMIQVAYFQYDVASLEVEADADVENAEVEVTDDEPQMLFPVGLTEFVESKTEGSDNDPFEDDEEVVAAVEVELLEGGVVQRKLHKDVEALKSDMQELKDSTKQMAEMMELLVRQVTNPDRGRARRR